MDAFGLLQRRHVTRTGDAFETRARNRGRQSLTARRIAVAVFVPMQNPDRHRQTPQSRSQIARRAGLQILQPHPRIGLHDLSPGLAHHPDVGLCGKERGVEGLRATATDHVPQDRNLVGGIRGRGRRTDRDHRFHRRGVVEGQRQGNLAAKTVPDDHRRRCLHALEKRRHDPGPFRDRRRPLETAGAPMCGEVQRQGRVVGCEVGELAGPEPSVAPDAMQEEQAGSPVQGRRLGGQRAGAGVLVVERELAVVQVLRGHPECLRIARRPSQIWRSTIRPAMLVDIETIGHWFQAWPLGVLCIATSRLGLRRITWSEDDDRDALARRLREEFPNASLLEREPDPGMAREFDEFFAGERKRFEIAVDPRPTSPFRERVLRRLMHTRYGETLSYGELATAVGKPGAARAVGRAMATNPLPIVIPCHRVLPADRSLGHYTGGAHVKAFLLELEGVSPGTPLLAPAFR